MLEDGRILCDWQDLPFKNYAPGEWGEFYPTYYTFWCHIWEGSVNVHPVTFLFCFLIIWRSKILRNSFWFMGLAEPELSTYNPFKLSNTSWIHAPMWFVTKICCIYIWLINDFHVVVTIQYRTTNLLPRGKHCMSVVGILVWYEAERAILAGGESDSPRGGGWSGDRLQANSKCRVDLCLRSLHTSLPVVFKVQTSSPLKFLISTLCGVMSPLSLVSIHVVRGVPLHL